jgi:uncharacterized membrane protein YeaQ/YmgE (transglycosylase-associated protein family)
MPHESGGGSGRRSVPVLWRFVDVIRRIKTLENLHKMPSLRGDGRIHHNRATVARWGFVFVRDGNRITARSPGKGAGMTITGIIMAIVIGAIIGALARFVLPGRQNIGILLTIVIGIVAALLGTWLAQLVGVAVTPGIDWIEIVFQVGLAAIAVALFAGVGSRRSV